MMFRLKSVVAVSAAAALSSLSIPTFSQVEIEESRNRVFPVTLPSSNAGDTTPGATTETVTQQTLPAGDSGVSVYTPAANPQLELFNQLQVLQQEVSSLRGLLEEQSYEIKRLKQQRLEDYMNLDRRVSELSQSGVSVGSSEATVSGVSGQGNPVPQVTTGDETAEYKAAIDLLLSKKDYDGAVEAFSAYIDKYPNGRFSVNSQYWLGEIALLNGDMGKANTWFSGIVNNHPTHAKYADAQYKLATVLFKQGDQDGARGIFEQVAQGSGNAARLATDFLNSQF